MRHDKHVIHMTRALKLAQRAAEAGEVPIGAVVVYEDKVIAEAGNERETNKIATHHAEIRVIEQACQKLDRWRLSGCDLYVTLEPCTMCAGAIVLARFDKVIFGAKDPKAGAVGSLYNILTDARLNHRPEIIESVMAEECGKILSDFFRARRS
jgi:tRNA(adenine34) deaminase